MDHGYSIEPSQQQWLVTVDGVGFFLCRKRRDAFQAVRLAGDLIESRADHVRAMFEAGSYEAVPQNGRRPRTR